LRVTATFAMRNQIVPRKLLERIYIEGVQESPGFQRGVPRCCATPSRARSGEGGSARARMSAPAAAIAFVLGELLDAACRI